jgi:hypothetical protein
MKITKSMIGMILTTTLCVGINFIASNEPILNLIGGGLIGASVGLIINIDKFER